MNKMLLAVVIVVVLGVLGRVVLTVPAVQDALLARGSAAAAQGIGASFSESDNLRVYVCGSASPLGIGQAQACIAVVTPDHFYIIDSGAGSTDNINRLGLPIERLQGILVTHFHSDHIAEIYEVNLGSWVAGRANPLKIYGPQGIEEVVSGINASYRLDRIYRTEHHGEDLLAPEMGLLAHQTIVPGVILDEGDLKITAYRSEHPPIEPAVGYRFDYRGRSVVVSGDSNVNGDTFDIVNDADLLLHDALSLPTVTSLSEAMAAVDRDRRSKILDDVIDYHASTDSLIELGEKSNVSMVAFYHLVPVPMNGVLEQVFTRGVPDHFLLAEDLMWFDLPINSDDILVNLP